ncbi:MAG TPA: EpsG family protein [Ginsengibacter sp.]
MIIYFIYFIVLAIIAVEYELNPFKSNGLLIFITLSLALLAGLRGQEVSRDYLPYQYAFDNIQEFIGNGSIMNFGIYEPGFIGIVILFKFFFIQNYGVAIMLFFAIGSVAMKIFVIDRFSINPYLVILLYFSHYFIIHEMTQIRIGFASAIFLVSLIFYFKNNYKAYIGMILVATMFHYSAFGYLLLLLFNKTSFNLYFYSALILSAIILGFLRLPLFNFAGGILSSFDNNGKIDAYSTLMEFNLVDDVKVFNFINLAKIICTLYLMFLIPKAQLLRDSHLIFFLKCNILSIFTLSLFSGVPLIAFRISDLYGVISMFNFAYLARYLPFSKYNIWIVVLIAGLLFYLNAIHGGLLNPYKMIKIIK